LSRDPLSASTASLSATTSSLIGVATSSTISSLLPNNIEGDIITNSASDAVVEGSKISGLSTIYTLKFINTNPIPNLGRVVITIPSSLVLAFSSSQGCGSAATSQFEICTLSGTELTLVAKTNINGGTTI